MQASLTLLLMTYGREEEIRLRECCMPIRKSFHQELKHWQITSIAKGLSSVFIQMPVLRLVVKCPAATVMKERMQNFLQNGELIFLNMIIVFVLITYLLITITRWPLAGIRLWEMRLK